MEYIVVFALLLVCPLAAGKIASDKGRSAVLWAMIGFFLGIFGVLIALLVPKRAAETV